MILRRVLARRVREYSRSMHTSYWHAHTSGTFCPGVSDLRKNNFCAKNSHTPIHCMMCMHYSTVLGVREYESTSRSSIIIILCICIL